MITQIVVVYNSDNPSDKNYDYYSANNQINIDVTVYYMIEFIKQII